jgi:hypothetical protein
MEHQIGHFLTDRDRVSLVEGVIELEDLLDQVRSQGFPGLDPVPGAPATEVADDVESASKR